MESPPPERDEKGQLLPGNTANPQGHNGKTPVTDALRAFLTRNDKAPDDETPLNNAQRIALEWGKKAKAGELPAITSLVERVEGKTPDTVRHEGKFLFTMNFGTGPHKSAEE